MVTSGVGPLCCISGIVLCMTFDVVFLDNSSVFLCTGLCLLTKVDYSRLSFAFVPLTCSILCGLCFVVVDSWVFLRISLELK